MAKKNKSVEAIFLSQHDDSDVEDDEKQKETKRAGIFLGEGESQEGEGQTIEQDKKE